VTIKIKNQRTMSAFVLIANSDPATKPTTTS
jgi:hypothetical protein